MRRHFQIALTIVIAAATVKTASASDLLVGNKFGHTPANVLRADPSTGSVTGVFGQANNFDPAPGMMARDSLGRIYILDSNRDTIQRFDSSGNFIDLFASTGFKVNGLFYGMVIDASDNVYVSSDGLSSSTSDDAIVRFDSNGHLLGTFGQATNAASGFNTVNAAGSLARDNQGNIYVSLTTPSKEVLRYSPDGTFLGTFGQATQAASGMDAVWAMVFDNNGNCFVRTFGRIMEFDSAGNYLHSFGSLSTVGGLAYDGSGHLYTSNLEWNNVFEFDVNGTLMRTLSSPSFDGPGNLLFIAPEPGTLALTAIAVPLLFRRHRR